jgi:hypothetical protein
MRTRRADCCALTVARALGAWPRSHPDKAEATAVVERISGDVRDLMGWTMLPE